MKNELGWGLALGLVAALLSVGCGDGDVCMSQCTEAQERGCTSIANCANWCSALDEVAAEADCQSERDAIDDCGGSVDACAVEASCSTQANRFATCSNDYCTQIPPPDACIRVANGGR